MSTSQQEQVTDHISAPLGGKAHDARRVTLQDTVLRSASEKLTSWWRSTRDLVTTVIGFVRDAYKPLRVRAVKCTRRTRQKASLFCEKRSSNPFHHGHAPQKASSAAHRSPHQSGAPSHYSDLQQRKPRILNLKKAYTLVLDLDETLVCTSTSRPSKDAVEVFVPEPNNRLSKLYACLRPHLHEFLAGVSQYYDVVVYTSATQEYADKIINLFDAAGQYVCARLYRDACEPGKGTYIKNLGKHFPNLKKVVIIDDNKDAVSLSDHNAIVIKPFKGDANDQELKQYLKYLVKMATDTDDTDIPERIRALKEEIAHLHDARRPVI